jgi:hypothetical protein
MQKGTILRHKKLNITARVDSIQENQIKAVSTENKSMMFLIKESSWEKNWKIEV